MPELPEVETVKNILASSITNKVIEKVEVFRAKNIDGDPKEFISSLKGRVIKSFSRVGKFIIFHFDNSLVMISHLRMEGKYYLKEKGEPITKHDLIVFYFKDGTTREIRWKNPSRGESWTPEMKELARQRAIAQNQKKGADGRWQKS